MWLEDPGQGRGSAGRRPFGRGGQRRGFLMPCFEGLAGFKRSVELLTHDQDRCSLPVKCVQGRQMEAPARSRGTCSTWSLIGHLGRWGPSPVSKDLHGLRPRGRRGRGSGPAQLTSALGSLPIPMRLSPKSGSRGESTLHACAERVSWSQNQELAPCPRESTPTTSA